MNPAEETRRRDRLTAQSQSGGRKRRFLATSGAGSGEPVRRLRVLLWTGRLLLAGALAVAVGYLPYHLYLRSGLSQFVALRAELAQLQERNQKLRSGIVELRLQLERFAQDSDALERVARDELGLVRSGEVVFKVE